MRLRGERITKYYVKEKYESEAKPTNCRTLAAAKREASKAQQFLETTIIVEDENGEVVACKSPDDHWMNVKVTKYQIGCLKSYNDVLVYSEIGARTLADAKRSASLTERFKGSTLIVADEVGNILAYKHKGGKWVNCDEE